MDPKQSKLQSVCIFLTWTPKRCRYDPFNPPSFSIYLNLLFATACTFTVGNIYYCYPILNRMAEDFDVSFERVSVVPTLMQTGYAAGLCFLCPLGDVFPRRTLVLALVFVTATLWIGLCITKSFSMFCFLSFLASVTTVTPQLMLPLVGGLAPPHRKATAISIVFSGLLLGVLIARLLSGIMTEYMDWRNVYWLSLGLQYLVLCLLWLFMPHYPSANPDGLNYFRMLWSIVTITFHEPLLAQACIVGLFTAAIFSSFWTTLTFLLASPPYEYSTIVIGLFSLIGIASLALGPVYSHFVMNRFVPLFSVIFGEVLSLAGAIIGTYTGTFNVSGLVIEAFAVDLGMQISQIANRNSIYAISPLTRNRINTAYTVSIFCGQLVGTSACNHLYAHGGWIRSGSASVGFLGAALLVCFLRGPWENRWIGWRGGWDLRPRKPEEDNLDIEVNGAVNISGINQHCDQKHLTAVDEKVGEGKSKNTLDSANKNQHTMINTSNIEILEKREQTQ